MKQIYNFVRYISPLGRELKAELYGIANGALFFFIAEGAHTKEILYRGVGEYDTEFCTRNCERHDAAVRCLVRVTAYAHLVVVLKARAHLRHALTSFKMVVASFT